MLGWLIPLVYMSGSFGTWITGAVKIGARLEELQAKHDSYDLTKPEFRAGVWAFLTGLIWPIGLPVYLAFDRGKGLGLKRKQMKLLLAEAEAEIARIKKKEGWA